ncbi:NlpC/P60 family protein [uncultured Jannaschia sp.]|uniref:NlpC/P60 family protein n=1 Tax=uncultured Jannaschia sp. TaxID=293347 RepID=UPI0026381B7C|nr:NlpC/P60 family protein [uncultured Jannaschia sp.]
MIEVAVSARQWIGTPYVHQASVKGVGADCLGLVRGIWRELYGDEPAAVPNYSRDWGESRADECLRAAAEAVMTIVEPQKALLPGQVLLFRMRQGSIAKHLGVLGDVDPVATFIHAYSGRAVHESMLSKPWQKRLVARFSFPQVMR